MKNLILLNGLFFILLNVICSQTVTFTLESNFTDDNVYYSGNSNSAEIEDLIEDLRSATFSWYGQFEAGSTAMFTNNVNTLFFDKAAGVDTAYLDISGSDGYDGRYPIDEYGELHVTSQNNWGRISFRGHYITLGGIQLNIETPTFYFPSNNIFDSTLSTAIAGYTYQLEDDWRITFEAGQYPNNSIYDVTSYGYSSTGYIIAETVDSDGDGVGDNADAFPNDSSETQDSDGDGVGDNADAFPNDASETIDSDGDGVGDNADAFPSDAAETQDSDGDGVGDNADAFPNDSSETIDSDGDGVGDNTDAFPNDASETVDSDGDGVGDNTDAFPSDATESADTDGDGIGDNTDAFPNEYDNSVHLTFTLNNAETAYSVTNTNIPFISGSLVIPNTYNGLPVTSIGAYTFDGHSNLTSVVIPNSITSIGSRAFRGCRGLTSVVLPNNITSLSFQIFDSCDALSSVIIPDSVISIGEQTFSDCGLTSIIIPDSVTTIGDSAFLRCESLSRLSIGKNVRVIKQAAFDGCSNLREISSLAKVAPTLETDYHTNQFRGVAAQEIIVPADSSGYGSSYGIQFALNVVINPWTYIEEDGGATITASIASGDVIIPSFLFRFPVLKIGDGQSPVFGSPSTNVTSINIPESVNRISDNAFNGCTSLSFIRSDATTAPSLGGNAFNDVATQQILVPVGSSGYDQIYGGLNVILNYWTFIIENGGITITASTATGNVSIPSVLAGLPVWKVGYGLEAPDYDPYSFNFVEEPVSHPVFDSSNTSVTSITIPDSVTKIGAGAFINNPNLNSVSIGDSVSNIGINSFRECYSLVSVSLGDNVSNIGNNAFLNCHSLTNINIPNWLEITIGDNAFWGTGITTMYSQGAYSSAKTESRTAGQQDVINDPTSYNGVVDQIVYDAVVTQRDARPTQVAYDAVLAERNARLTESEVRDLRLGSSMLGVVDGDASINIELEATDNLGITSPTWTPVPESKIIVHSTFQNGKIKIDVEADDAANAGVRFFRFKMTE